MIGVLGAGAFGTALAIALARHGTPVALWARDPETVAAINHTHRAPRLPGATLPDTITASTDIARVARAETLLLATPMQSLHAVLSQVASPLTGQRVVACCKGIDVTDLTGPTGVIARAKPQAIAAILTGPSFADDIARGLPTALTLACADADAGWRLQRDLSTPTLRLYRSTDAIGAELGGALKNVIAIACGACIGIGLGDSARAALMTRGFAEMSRLATTLGARANTLAGLSGLGDLSLTCTSDLSRNYRFGLALGRGTTFDASLTVEGVKTAEAVTRLAARLGLDLPICRSVAEVSGGTVSVGDAITRLLNRPLKEE
ncbi:glycerol-3-phosphate dehydrogenase [Salipiger aestuarii]|uniref:Glycerol-3-phosphate dehydrogenase [NAD(P)+] n=1 Tax=Salipiger aestuarii TaxID=568098 RepID=A0A327YMM3_9RHOB|nr:NAD(P)H-dependent glycerol-3-phosphate dehydrogenase [Salipiger aestuarii]EIE50129.1 NAD(P)H-dependent glycerol-3-phosphate dehydrogenase [Citreicella sp. 357]KAA8609914.1 glycerol-3-phosphate dehydrogenase [Salipiger aestuarii]KAA8616226.1 glycerol-3-phosphate dehydrogenase [Salipiger aestuarii]KAB2543173.1 glycerol-3-phosphate dehydrogenase [Salipiger aestuarii]RAK21496.1 glycerol-3-phosphate dehydrogenase (NAD(P)+) [Salipiger aestuarii]